MTLHNLFSLNFSSEIQDTFLLNAQKLKIFKRWSMSSTDYFCEAARANTMTGSLDLSFGFPWNGKIPYPHQVTWSQPINRRLTGNKGNISRESWKACECLSLNKSLQKLQQEPWLESVINFPFLRVALSWKPSLFPLGDSDIRHDNF